MASKRIQFMCKWLDWCVLITCPVVLVCRCLTHLQTQRRSLHWGWCCGVTCRTHWQLYTGLPWRAGWRWGWGRCWRLAPHLEISGRRGRWQKIGEKAAKGEWDVIWRTHGEEDSQKGKKERGEMAGMSINQRERETKTEKHIRIHFSIWSLFVSTS